MIEFLLGQCSFSHQSPLQNSSIDHSFNGNSNDPKEFCFGKILQKNPNIHLRQDDNKSFVNNLETSRISQNVSENESWGKG